VSGLRFFGQMIWLAILCAFGWLVTFALSGQWWVFPVLFVGLVVVAIHRAREKQGRIAILAAEADGARRSEHVSVAISAGQGIWAST
jgi:hypothetical protein